MVPNRLKRHNYNLVEKPSKVQEERICYERFKSNLNLTHVPQMEKLYWFILHTNNNTTAICSAYAMLDILILYWNLYNQQTFWHICLGTKISINFSFRPMKSQRWAWKDFCIHSSLDPGSSSRILMILKIIRRPCFLSITRLIEIKFSYIMLLHSGYKF